MFEQNPLVSKSDVQSLGSGAAISGTCACWPTPKTALAAGWRVPDWRRLPSHWPCDAPPTCWWFPTSPSASTAAWQMARDGKGWDGKRHHDFEHETGENCDVWDVTWCNHPLVELFFFEFGIALYFFLGKSLKKTSWIFQPAIGYPVLSCCFFFFWDTN